MRTKKAGYKKDLLVCIRPQFFILFIKHSFQPCGQMAYPGAADYYLCGFGSSLADWSWSFRYSTKYSISSLG